MTVWFTADHHFGHARSIDMCRRPFADVDEMNREMILRWNAVVQPGDEVWHLGDFCYRSAVHPESIFNRLHGRKSLIVGNHDSLRTRELGWVGVSESAEVVIEGTRLFLSHYPHLEWPGYWRGSVHLFGHVHGNRQGAGRSCDVGVDAWDYRPVRVSEVLERIGDAVNA